MKADNKELGELLAKYPRAVTHLRAQVEKKRFGLVLGAGISVELKVPMWVSLVESIAADPEVDGTPLLKGVASKNSLPYQTELLFQRFREKKIKEKGEAQTISLENLIAAEWLTLCQKYIYRDAENDIGTALKNHSYLASLVPLIQQSALTINFNFDDFLERSLQHARLERDQNNRGFEAVTDPWPQFRRTDSVVYHPHGYVPAGLMEGAVDRFVFSEAAYSKQYVGSPAYDSAFMIAHFARNTCLLIGCSLEDELRNILIKSAQINPGNYHYYCHFVREGAEIQEEERRLIEDTNFKIYNLITLFVSAADISKLLQLLNSSCVDEGRFEDLQVWANTRCKFNFYLTGAIGVGKSTTANLLRSLTVLDEWTEKRLPILGKPWDQLTSEEQTEADTWISDQFGKKNEALRQMRAPAICVIDRPPLDPIVFTKPEDQCAKATSLLKVLCPVKGLHVEPGVVILLLGIPDELSARVRATGRADYTDEKLDYMQNAMRKLYEPIEGVVTIDARYLTIAEVTKKVAEVIHRSEYKAADLTGELRKLAGQKDEPVCA